MVLQINAYDGPHRSIGLVRDFQHIAATHWILLVHVGDGQANTGLPILNGEVHVYDEELLWQHKHFDIELR